MLSSSQSDLESIFNSFDYLTLLLNEEQFELFRKEIENCILSKGVFGEDIKRNLAFISFLLDISELLKGNIRSVPPALNQEYQKMMPIFEYITSTILRTQSRESE